MVHLQDLPNELLLKIAARAETNERRRFSKTCRTLFYLIREQINWKKYNVKKEVGTVHVQIFSKDSCFVFISDIDSVKCYSITTSREVDDDAFWEMITTLVGPEEPGPTIIYIQTDNVMETTAEFLRDVEQYCSAKYRFFESPLELFDIRIAELMGQVEERITIEIAHNDFSAALQDVHFELFKVFLNLNTFKRTDGKPFFQFRHLNSKREESAIDAMSTHIREWRHAIMDRMRNECDEREIPHNFVRDQRKMEDFYRDLVLRHLSDGRVDGRFLVVRSSRRHRQCKNRTIEAHFDWDSDEWNS